MEEVKVYSERIAANLGCFHDEDRGSILCWLERLNRCPKDEEEAGRLAEYARYLNHVIANGRIHYPFTDPPPCRKLPPLQEYFRRCRETCPAKAETPSVFQTSSVATAWSPEISCPQASGGRPPTTCGNLQPQAAWRPQVPETVQLASPSSYRAPSDQPSCANSGYMEMSIASPTVAPAGWTPRTPFSRPVQEPPTPCQDPIQSPYPSPALHCSAMPPCSPMAMLPHQSPPISPPSTRAPCEPSPKPPCPTPPKPPCPPPTSSPCPPSVSGVGLPRTPARRHISFASLDATDTEPIPQFNDYDGIEQFRYLKNMSVGQLLQEYDRIDDAAKRDAVLSVLHDLLAYERLGRPKAASTPRGHCPPIQGPVLPTIEELQNMEPDELVELFKGELKTEPNPYTSIRLYHMAEIVSKVMTRLKGKEMKVWPFHDLPSVDSNYAHIRHMPLDGLLKELMTGEKESTRRHDKVMEALEAIFWGRGRGGKIFSKGDIRGFHLSPPAADRVPFRDILKLNLKEVTQLLVKEFRMLDKPHGSIRVQVLYALATKYGRLKEQPRYPHIHNLSVGRLLEEFEKGSHEKTSRNEVIVQMLKDIFWKDEQPNAAKNRHGFVLERDMMGKASLDDILKMNLEELEEHLVQELTFHPNPTKSVRVMMMSYILRKLTRLKNLTEQTGKPIEKCPTDQEQAGTE